MSNVAEKNNLAWRWIHRSAFGVAATAAPLFLTAGTIDFWQAWVLILISDIVPVFCIIYFYQRAPELLERRLLKQDTIIQRFIIKCGKTVMLASLAVAGFDYRCGWSAALWQPVPLWLETIAFALLCGAIGLNFEVLKANRFAASVIRTETGQTVIDTGPYSIIRHPMYFGSMVSCLLIPIALGSFVALPVSALVIPLLILRLLKEEKFLREHLVGYSEYCERTRYRLLPSIW